jgi:hypothetical protein
MVMQLNGHKKAEKQPKTARGISPGEVLEFCKLLNYNSFLRGKGGKGFLNINTHLLTLTDNKPRARGEEFSTLLTFPPFPCYYYMIYYYIGKSKYKRRGKKEGKEKGEGKEQHG